MHRLPLPLAHHLSRRELPGVRSLLAFGRLPGIAMGAQRDAAIGASHHERSEDRRGHRNGYKPKTLTTRVGEIEIRVPRTRGIPFHLADRDMHGLRHIVSDDHAGLKVAGEACFPSVPWQR